MYYGFEPHSSPNGLDFYEPGRMAPEAITFAAEFHGRAFVARFGNLEPVLNVGFDVITLRLNDADEAITCNRFLVGLGRVNDVLCAYNGRVYVLEYNQETGCCWSGWGTPSRLYEIAYTVAAAPIIQLSTTSIHRAVDFTAPLPDDTFTISNGGAGTLNFTVAADQPWINVSPISGSSTGPADSVSITISYSTIDLAIGTHRATITVEDEAAANHPRFIDVTVNVKSVLPDFDVDADVDLGDFGYLQACLSPVMGGPPPSGSNPADLDGDGVVDIKDIQVFQDCLSGPETLVDFACDDAYE